MDSGKPLAGGIPMVSIDGVKIRLIREEKGLTQLYVATVVGVTTDTISRWENRRYPSIKKENAVKLAEALETQIEDIIDHTQPDPLTEQISSQSFSQPRQNNHPSKPETADGSVDPQTSPVFKEIVPTTATPTSPLPWLRLALQPFVVLFATILLALGGLILLWWYTANEGIHQVEVFRTLPEHATPGIPFPVVIEVTTNVSKPFSLILKEILPPDCLPTQGKPLFTSQSTSPPVLKWISKIIGGRAVYSYLARLKPETKIGTFHQFTGGITLRSGNNPSTPMIGGEILKASPFHWADSNSDGRIDDAELLYVNEVYGGLEGLNFDKKLIDEIWAARGYRWNPEMRNYAIIP